MSQSKWMSKLNLKAAFKTWAVKGLYNTVVSKTADAPMEFMNYGYALLDGEPPLGNISGDDEYYRYLIQLYLHTLGGVDLQGKQLLEVGSGRGGGASWVSRNLKPARLTGVDLNEKQIELANARYGHDGLKFMHGNAQDLPFANDTYDAVYNIESSHCYPDQRVFFSEVYRVLKKGGHFLYTDFRDVPQMDAVRDDLARVGFKVVRECDITPNVVRSLELDEARKTALLNKIFPSEKERRGFRIAYAMQGDDIKQQSRYYKFKDGRSIYYSFILEK